jgi:predicted transcriptional regulator
MENLGGFFKSMLMEVSSEMEEANKANKRKIQEAVDKYWDACNYPRKKKKKMRKEAQRDYSFWVSIDKWYEKEFSFLKL